MRILICGHSSFASQGLPQLLREAGHEVVCFGRGAISRRDDPALGIVVSGPVAELHANPHLGLEGAGRFDAVVNYILLKDESIDRNVAYTRSLMQFCGDTGVKHLVHISSVSSYSGSARKVDEQATLETDPLKKGSYGSLKVASDIDVLNRCPAETKLTMVRPGFILGAGLVDPIIGTGVRLPWNKLLLIGAAKAQFPVISRAILNETIRRALENPPAEAVESLLLVSDASPTRLEFLQAVAEQLGAGESAVAFPVAMWWTVAAGSEVVARLIGQGKLKPFSKLASKLGTVSFDSTRSQRRIGMKFDTNWRALLRESLDGQYSNFTLPFEPGKVEAQLNAATPPGSVAFLGFGRIVKQKHLPALERIGFTGKPTAYDLQARTDENGQEVRALTDGDPERADLYVIASPGPAHASAIERIKDRAGTVLVEKPLCYTPYELNQWREFTASRQGPVIVCHNYRYKDNVLSMLKLLKHRNPGRLRHVHVDFQSPPASNDSAAWLRNERKARTLLLDYSLHFLDLGCMFCSSPWRLEHIRHELNAIGQTSLIEGAAQADYSVSFLLRQGFAPRRARLMFSFQNYSVSLAFFPETMIAHMANDNAWLYKQEAKALGKATRRKVLDKLTGRDSDLSHARVFAAALGDAPPMAPTVGSTANFYELLFGVADAVYGH